MGGGGGGEERGWGGGERGELHVASLIYGKEDGKVSVTSRHAPVIA